MKSVNAANPHMQNRSDMNNTIITKHKQPAVMVLNDAWTPSMELRGHYTSSPAAALIWIQFSSCYT